MADDYNPLFEDAAKRYGLPANWLPTFARIESGGNPFNRTGSYKGLFQLSDSEFRKHGGQGNIFDPAANTDAAAAKLARERDGFRSKYGREPSASELYLIHQQGEGGAAAHWSNPDRPAWQNMLSTAEGQQKGPAWAKAAIWGNVPNDVKAKYGSVDNISSRDFSNLWETKVTRFSGDGAPTQVADATPTPTAGRSTLGGPPPPIDDAGNTSADYGKLLDAFGPPTATPARVGAMPPPDTTVPSTSKGGGYGGYEGYTPEGIARQKELVEALLAKSNARPMYHWLEPVGQIADAISNKVQLGRLNDAQIAGQRGFQAELDAALASGNPDAAHLAKLAAHPFAVPGTLSVLQNEANRRQQFEQQKQLAEYQRQLDENSQKGKLNLSLLQTQVDAARQRAAMGAELFGAPGGAQPSGGPVSSGPSAPPMPQSMPPTSQPMPGIGVGPAGQAAAPLPAPASPPVGASPQTQAPGMSLREKIAALPPERRMALYEAYNDKSPKFYEMLDDLSAGDPQQRTFNKEYAKEQAPKLHSEASKNYASASDQYNTYAAMEQLAPYAKTGFGADQVLALRKLGSQFGITDQSIAPTEIYKFLAQKGVFDMTKQLKPASNLDMIASEKATASMQSDPSTLPMALPVLKTIAQRTMLSHKLEMEAYKKGQPPDPEAIQKQINAQMPLDMSGLLGLGGNQAPAQGAAGAAPAAPTITSKEDLLKMPDGPIPGTKFVKRGDKLFPIETYGTQANPYLNKSEINKPGEFALDNGKLLKRTPNFIFDRYQEVPQ